MKHNTFKRVLAGSLALLTVASPMTANVGGILQEISIVANAAQGDAVKVTWGDALAPYIDSVTVGETTAPDTANTGYYNFTTGQGQTATIVSSVPVTDSIENGVDAVREAAFVAATFETNPEVYRFLTYAEMSASSDFLNADLNEIAEKHLGTGKTWANMNDTELQAFFNYCVNHPEQYGKYVNDDTFRTKLDWENAKDKFKYTYYKDVTATVTANSNYVMKPGEFTVKEETKNKKTTWTYNLVMRQDKGKYEQDNLTLVGDTTNVKFAYNKNSVDGAPTTLQAFGVTFKGVDTSAVVSRPTVDGSENYDLTKNSNVTLTSKNFFKVTASYTGHSGSVDSEYNADGTYSATIAVPNTNDDVTLTVVALNEAELAYTVSDDGTTLFANGKNVAENSIAASITASAYREEVKDDDNVLVDEEIDDKNFATNGKIKYGTGENDGVTVKITRDPRLLTTRTNGDEMTTQALLLTITKDGKTWAGIENARFAYVDNGWSVLDVNDKEYNAEEHVYNKKVEGGDGAVKLTEADLIGILNGEFRFTESGNYNFDVTVYSKTFDNQGKPLASEMRDIKFKFQIQPIEVQTTDFTFQLFKDEKCTQAVEDMTPTAVAFAKDGSVVVQVPEGHENDVFFAKIAPKSKVLEGFSSIGVNDIPKNLAQGFGKYYVSGPLRVGGSDNEVKSVQFKIFDQNYGATLDNKNGNDPKVIDLTYQLTAAPLVPTITTQLDAEDVVNRGSGEFLRIAQVDAEDADKFTEIFWNNYEGNAAVEDNKDKVTFAYLPGMGYSYQDDYLSSVINGFPTEPDQDGYTLFAVLNDELIWSGDVRVVSTKATLRMKDSALKQTYGDALNVTDYELVDSDGNVIPGLELESLKIKSIYYAEDENQNTAKGKRDGVTPYKKSDGKYATTTAVTNDIPGVTGVEAHDYSKALLNAGVYVVEYEAKTATNADFVVKAEQQILTINKRQISDDMFYVVDKDYTEKALDRNMVQFRWSTSDQYGRQFQDFDTVAERDGYKLVKQLVDDKEYYSPINVTVTSGTDNAVEVGHYTLNLRANEAPNNDYGNDTNYYFTGNFTGTAKTSWCVTPMQTEDWDDNPTSAVDFGFKWDNQKTTIYDHGQIHVQYTVNDPESPDMKLPDGVTVDDYGCIVLKSNQIPAPVSKATGKKLTMEEYQQQKNGGADSEAVIDKKVLDNVKAQLKYRDAQFTPGKGYVYGNGFTEGHVSDVNRANNMYGANIGVPGNGDTDEWVIPYGVLSNGAVQYGDPIYLDLNMEATRVLGIEFNAERNAKNEINHPGYQADLNAYQAYATRNAITDLTIKAQIKDFGVIVARDGQFDRLGISEANHVTNAAEDMTLDNAKKLGLVVGHNDKRPNAFLPQEEYRARIAPGKHDEGMWVRTYLDLGNGLVVYTPVEYYESPSEYYRGDVAGVRGAYTRDLNAPYPNQNAAFLLEDLNKNAVDVEKKDDIAHNTRVVTTGDPVGNDTIATPDKVTTKYVNYPRQQYTFTFVNTVRNTNTHYTFVENGFVVCDDESIIDRVTDQDGKTRYSLKSNAEQKLVLDNGFNEGRHNTTASQQTYTGHIYRNGNRIVAVRAWQKFKTPEGMTITVYGPITMNYEGVDLLTTDYIQNGVVYDKDGKVVDRNNA